MQEQISSIIRKSIMTKGLWIDIDNHDMIENYLTNICNIRCENSDELFSAYRNAVDNIDLCALKVRKYYVKASYGVDIFFARSKGTVVDFVESHYVNRFGNKLPRRSIIKLVVSD